MHSATLLSVFFSALSLTSALVVPTPRQGSASEIIKRNQVKRSDLQKKTLCIPGTPFEIFCGGNTGGGGTGGGSHPPPSHPSSVPPTCKLNGEDCPFDQGYKCNSSGQCVKRCLETGTIWDLFNKECKCDIGFKKHTHNLGKRTFTITCEPEECEGHHVKYIDGQCKCDSGYEMVGGECKEKCADGEIRQNGHCVEECHSTHLSHVRQCSSGGCELIEEGNCSIFHHIPCADGLRCNIFGKCKPHY